MLESIHFLIIKNKPNIPEKMYSLTDLCCLCLVNGNTIRSILSQDNDGIVVKNKMEYVFSEAMNYKSEVLKDICVDCLNALNYVYKFKRECLQNLVSLNNFIENMSMKTQENGELGGLQDQLTCATQHNRTEKFETIQIKNSQPSHSQILKCERSNEECSVSLDNSEHSLYENPIPENIEEIEIVKQELEYIENDMDPLFLDDNTEENSRDNLPEDPANNSVISFSCDSCSTRYSRKASYNRHIRLKHRIYDADNGNQENEATNDTGFIQTSTAVGKNELKKIERRYNCNQCDKVFQKPNQLEKHSLTHTGERPFKCTTCQKAFALQSNLKSHEMTHTGEKPFPCEVCPSAFTTKKDLARHTLIHTNIRPYKCPVCPKAFIRSNYIARHMRVHTGEKPYQCKICKYKCADTANLKMHMRVHTGEKPYTCKHCNRAFSASGTLSRHMRLVHNYL